MDREGRLGDTSFFPRQLDERLFFIKSGFPCNCKNTLALENIFAAEPLAPEIQNHPQLTILGNPQPMFFDDKGNLMLS